MRPLPKGGPGRPRKYKNVAAKQRAYRKRLKRAADPKQAAKDRRYALMRIGEAGPILPDSITLYQGDFREIGAQIPDNSVGLVLTDPPYGRDWLPYLDDLGALCARVLRPGGSLVAMHGQAYLETALHLLSQHLTYNWVLAYRLMSTAGAVHPNHVQNHWKPFYWYVKGKYTGDYIGDVVESEQGKDKRFADWGQSEQAFALLVKRFTDVGDTILDPVCGGGTTGAVALTLRRRFVGIDCDPEKIAITRARLSAIA